MDHRSFLASLPADTRAYLTQANDRRGLLHLAGHLGLILVCGVAIAARIPFWGGLLPVQGLLLVFLFTLQHETTHDTPFQSRWLNLRVGQFCGFVGGLPPAWFRFFHYAHHRHTQVPGKDPELAEPKPQTGRGYIWYVSGLPLWASLARTLWHNARGLCDAPYVPAARRAEIKAEARWMVLGYALLLGGSVAVQSAVLIWVWVLPMVLGQPALRLYLLAEHGRCAYVSNMFENTRTTFTTGALRWLAWNMPYHAEHHTYPAVPFHKLPDLHALMAAHLKETEQGYARFTRGYVRDLSQNAQRSE